MKRWQIVTLVVVAVLIVSLIGGAVWYFWGPCGKQIATTAWSDIRPTLSRWLDAMYAHNLDGMDILWRFSNTIYVPQCMHAQMLTLNQSLEDTLKAERAMQGGDASGSSYLIIGPSVIKEAGLELERLAQCAPFCR